MVEPIFDYQFRLILIGDSTVGKSSLLKYFTDGRFAEVIERFEYIIFALFLVSSTPKKFLHHTTKARSCLLIQNEWTESNQFIKHFRNTTVLRWNKDKLGCWFMWHINNVNLFITGYSDRNMYWMCRDKTASRVDYFCQSKWFLFFVNLQLIRLQLTSAMINCVERD